MRHPRTISTCPSAEKLITPDYLALETIQSLSQYFPYIADTLTILIYRLKLNTVYTISRKFLKEIYGVSCSTIHLNTFDLDSA